jgi:hypothetical protein
MDSDDLSISTYNGIIIESETFSHDLTLQFGVLTSDCKDDDDYLNQAEAMIRNWLKVDYFEEIIEDVFYSEPVDEKEFRDTLNKILSNITDIRKTPMKDREYENWG